MDVYALTPVSEVGQVEVTTASTSENMGQAPEYAPSTVHITTPSAPKPTGTPGGAAQGVVVTANGVNVRTGPGTNFPVVTQVNKGDVVTLKDQAFGWNKVVLGDGNTTGWIAGWLLSTPSA